MPGDDDLSTAGSVRVRLASGAIGVALLVACAAKPTAPVKPAAPTPTDAAVLVTSPSPSSAPMPTPDPPVAPASPVTVIVPTGGEARVFDLVLTAIEVREEQYDHKPGQGDVLAATLHIRRVGESAPSAAEMAAQRQVQVRVSSNAGAEGSRWRRFKFVVTGGDRNAVKLAVTPIPGPRSLGGVAITVAAQGTGTAAGLVVTVNEIVEKHMMDGRSVMRVKLHLRRADAPAPKPADMQKQQDSLVTLTSDPGEDIVTWNGYRIGYLGGWRSEVELKIVPPGG